MRSWDRSMVGIMVGVPVGAGKDVWEGSKVVGPAVWVAVAVG